MNLLLSLSLLLILGFAESQSVEYNCSSVELLISDYLYQTTQPVISSNISIEDFITNCNLTTQQYSNLVYINYWNQYSQLREKDTSNATRNSCFYQQDFSALPDAYVLSDQLLQRIYNDRDTTLITDDYASGFICGNVYAELTSLITECFAPYEVPFIIPQFLTLYCIYAPQNISSYLHIYNSEYTQNNTIASEILYDAFDACIEARDLKSTKQLFELLNEPIPDQRLVCGKAHALFNQTEAVLNTCIPDIFAGMHASLLEKYRETCIAPVRQRTNCVAQLLHGRSIFDQAFVLTDATVAQINRKPARNSSHVGFNGVICDNVYYGLSQDIQPCRVPLSDILNQANFRKMRDRRYPLVASCTNAPRNIGELLRHNYRR